MNDNRRRSGTNWGSILGWLVFILIFVGPVIFPRIRSLTGGNINIPSNILPMIVGAIVLLSIVVPVIRSIGSSMRTSGESRLPTGTDRPTQMPRSSTSYEQMSRPSTTRPYRMPRQTTPEVPPPLRYEPIINPTILMVGIIGLVLLGGFALFVLFQGTP